MKEVFIVDAIRTPVGKFGGSLKEIRPDDMAATLIKEILKEILIRIKFRKKK